MHEVTNAERVSKAASILGKMGASKGGKASSANMTPRQRKVRAKAAVDKRWDNWRKANPSGPKPPPVYVGRAESTLLDRIADGEVEVRWDKRARPTGRQQFNAALKLIDNGKARKVRSNIHKHGARITIARTD